MTWTRLDDGFPDHPKVMRAGALAAWLYTCGLCYCNRLLTDGFIPSGQLIKLADVPDPHGLAQKLITVNLWDHVDGGYMVHDFHECNPTAEEVKARREEISLKRAEAGRKGGLAKKQTKKQIASVLSKTDSSKTEAPSRTHPLTHPNTHPDLDQEEHAPARAGFSQRENFTGFFDSFWEAYPRRNGVKVGKQAAQQKALKFPIAERELILTAVRNYAASGERAKDAERFLSNDYWRGWLDVQAPTEIITNGQNNPKRESVTAHNLRVAQELYTDRPPDRDQEADTQGPRPGWKVITGGPGT